MIQNERCKDSNGRFKRSDGDSNLVGPLESYPFYYSQGFPRSLVSLFLLVTCNISVLKSSTRFSANTWFAKFSGSF